MLTKAWIALLMGLLLGSLFFSSGCGCLDDWGTSDYGAPAPIVTGSPSGGTPGWKPAATSSGTSGATNSSTPAGS